jgi:hypothetical protein
MWPRAQHIPECNLKLSRLYIFPVATLNECDRRTAMMLLHNLITPSCLLFLTKLVVVGVHPELQELHKR